MTYKAEYEDDEMEIFEAANYNEAEKEAYRLESAHGSLFNLLLLDENYDEIYRLI